MLCDCCGSSSLLTLCIASFLVNLLTKSMKRGRVALFSACLQLIWSTLLVILLLSSNVRLFFFARLCGVLSQNKDLDEKRCELLSLARGKVVEIGPGPGTNFRCWVKNKRVTALHLVEPNQFFDLDKAVREANLGFPVVLHKTTIEDFKEESNTFDYVVGTHVLCSVINMDSAWNSISLSLKRGGKYLLFEHVLSDQLGMRLAQILLQPIFYIVGSGCTFRDLALSMGRPNFVLDLHRWEAPLPIPFLKPHLVGTVKVK